MKYSNVTQYPVYVQTCQFVDSSDCNLAARFPSLNKRVSLSQPVFWHFSTETQLTVPGRLQHHPLKILFWRSQTSGSPQPISVQVKGIVIAPQPIGSVGISASTNGRGLRPRPQGHVGGATGALCPSLSI